MLPLARSLLHQTLGSSFRMFSRSRQVPLTCTSCLCSSVAISRMSIESLWSPYLCFPVWVFNSWMSFWDPYLENLGLMYVLGSWIASLMPCKRIPLEQPSVPNACTCLTGVEWLWGFGTLPGRVRCLIVSSSLVCAPPVQYIGHGYDRSMIKRL